MNDNIIEFLGIKDDKLKLIKIETIGDTKFVYLEALLEEHFCPVCGHRFHSKGTYTRTIKHPILQNGYKVIIKLKQRRYECSNPLCSETYKDSFTFVQESKRITNLIPFNILNELKDLHLTAVQVARRFDISDTYVHQVVSQYLDIQRLPLPQYLSVDEVYLHISNKDKYALVLMDFFTGEIIDILPNRLEGTTNKYFMDLPKKERDSVKYLICDMYNPYVQFTSRYFKNGVCIIDSYHVISWLINKINIYINNVKKRYQERDNQRLEQKNKNSNRKYKSIKESNEVYLLNEFRWILLKNKQEIHYTTYRKKYKKLNMTLDTYALESQFMALDPHFPRIRELKEMYIEFNDSEETDRDTLSAQLDDLINIYSKCEFDFFRDFAELLKRLKEEILNSFTYVTSEDGLSKRRLSNGPIEGFNRLVKDYKRNSHGVHNFEYTRARIIWSNRENESVLGIPKDLKEVTPEGKKRGKYKKKEKQNKD